MFKFYKSGAANANQFIINFEARLWLNVNDCILKQWSSVHKYFDFVGGGKNVFAKSLIRELGAYEISWPSSGFPRQPIKMYQKSAGYFAPFTLASSIRVNGAAAVLAGVSCSMFDWWLSTFVSNFSRDGCETEAGLRSCGRNSRSCGIHDGNDMLLPIPEKRALSILFFYFNFFVYFLIFVIFVILFNLFIANYLFWGKYLFLTLLVLAWSFMS